MKLRKNYNVVIAVHESITPSGPGHNLRDYCVSKYSGTVLFIAHPLLYIKECYDHSSRYELISDKSKKSITSIHIRLPEPLLYIKDVLFSIYWVLLSRKKYDVYIGLDPLNAIAGIFLSLIGVTKKVVYYSIDYFPNRFSNRVMNSIYHTLDKICVYYSDETWNASKSMKQARAKKGMVGHSFERQYHVPMGIWYNKVKRVNTDEVSKMKLIFIGHLVDFMGVDLPILSLKNLKKRFPQLHIHIIGGGEAELHLKEIVKNNNLIDRVTFHGWIKTEKEREELLRDGGIGLATFNTLILDDKVKNADPIKIKEYTQYGMPVIATDAISTKNEISKIKAGIIIKYNTKSFVKAVELLLSSQKNYILYRKNALTFAKKYDWNTIFQKNMSRIIKK